jgi:hypothetical protein
MKHVVVEARHMVPVHLHGAPEVVAQLLAAAGLARTIEEVLEELELLGRKTYRQPAAADKHSARRAV